MNRITDSHAVWEFMHEKLGLHWSDDFRGVCHFLDVDSQPGMLLLKESVAVAVGYNAFIGKTCCMHVCVQKPSAVTRGMIREAFEYPFDKCKLEAVIALVESSNEAALSFDKKLGFVERARIPNGGLEGDLVVLTMTRDECRWIRKEH